MEKTRISIRYSHPGSAEEAIVTSRSRRSAPSTDKKLIIFESEINFIVAETAEYTDRETGGEMFGYWTHSGSPVIHYVTGPGRGARREGTSFFQDEDYLERIGIHLNDKYALQHLGEWHSHHQMRLDHPSGGDINTVRRALDRYGFDAFALVICNITASNRGGRYQRSRRAAVVNNVLMNGFLFERESSASYVDCQWIALPGASPIRQIEDRPYRPQSVPRYELRPGLTTLADMRAGRSQRRPLSEEVGTHWGTTRDGERILREEKRAFDESGIEAKMLLTSQNEVSFVVNTGDGELQYELPDGFPDRPPRVVRRSRGGDDSLLDIIKESWAPHIRLAAIHEHVLRSLDGQRREHLTEPWGRKQPVPLAQEDPEGSANEGAAGWDRPGAPDQPANEGAASVVQELPADQQTRERRRSERPPQGASADSPVFKPEGYF